MSHSMYLSVREAIETAQRTIHKNAIDKGWWEEDGAKSFGECIALCHSELSEALEEFRNGLGYNQVYFRHPQNPIKVSDRYHLSEPLPPGTRGMKPEGIPIELADVIIRILDMSEWFGIDVAKAIEIKHVFNETRPHRHGGKKL